MILNTLVTLEPLCYKQNRNKKVLLRLNNGACGQILCSQHFYLAHFLRDPAHRAVMDVCPVCNLLQHIHVTCMGFVHGSVSHCLTGRGHPGSKVRDRGSCCESLDRGISLDSSGIDVLAFRESFCPLPVGTELSKNPVHHQKCRKNRSCQSLKRINLYTP